LNDAFIKQLPGAVRKDIDRRGKGDCRKSAALTKEDFVEGILATVLEHNSCEMSDYELTDEMKRDHVPRIPFAIWKWGVANRSQLRDADERLVMLSLMPQRVGVVTEDGIRVGAKLCFVYAESRKNEMFLRIKRKGGAIVLPISYDPWCVDYIYVLGDSADEVIIATLSPAHADYERWSWHEVEAYLSAERLIESGDRRATLERKVAALKAKDKIVKTVLERRGKPGSTSVKNVSELRESQRAADGGKQSARTAEVLGIPIGARNSATDDEDAELVALWKAREASREVS
jgi:hypothetical protein